MDMPKDLSFEQLEKLNEQLDRQLRQFKKQEHRPHSFSWKMLVLKVTVIGLALVLPFVILIRSSIFFYNVYHLNGWLSLTVGCLITILLLGVYAVFFTYRWGLGKRTFNYIIRGAMLLVLAYTFYGGMYYSSLNTKSEQIQSYYRSLHPIMRVALTTITLADDDLMVTDIQRNPEDYNRMGLPENEQSLHYLQPNGYVHAVDLRTRGTAAWKNGFLQFSFNVVGLSTIRHHGTADHLHVYLPLN